jgi:hypothetical protein
MAASRRRCLAVIAVLAAPWLAGCRTPTSADAGRVATGAWGGDHIRLDVTTGGATVEYDCAHGTIDAPIVTDDGGRFSVMGSHTFEHGGPIRVGDPPDRHPARYDGRVAGDTLRMTVTVTDAPQIIGDFTAVFGAASRLVKCL